MRIAVYVSDLAGSAQTYTSELVGEGGAKHVDGEGTVLLTETVRLGPERNPHGTREQVKAEIHALLGTRKAIWLPRGLTADYPRTASAPSAMWTSSPRSPVRVVVAHVQPDPAHPDHEVTQKVVGLLTAQTDARGRRLEVVEVPAPTVLEADGRWADTVTLVDARPIFAGGGGIHCISQQQPKAVVG
ncbi:agmatine deiminase family protein [Streptomyces sp. NPDC101152]|uniref:agmatine deiminase family protein n=1 Tax=Streptomyces sp. NPDC101152 TaxID=3366116 RepID=UPI00382A41A1